MEGFFRKTSGRLTLTLKTTKSCLIMTRNGYVGGHSLHIICFRVKIKRRGLSERVSRHTKKMSRLLLKRYEIHLTKKEKEQEHQREYQNTYFPKLRSF